MAEEKTIHYVCPVCGYEADLPEGADTVCPLCLAQMEAK